MLVLLREVNQEIVIQPGDIHIMLVRVGPGKKARIGVRAPKEFTVHRKEVWDAIEAQKATEAGNEHESI